MATKKQRKRLEKGRRHEYETVWVDAEGNELDEPPDDTPAPARERRSSDGRPAPRTRKESRATKTPLPPSWRRSVRRSLLLGAVIFAVFALFNAKKGGTGIASAVLLAVIYTAIFIPFTYYLDRFVYRRWERRVAERPTKKR